MLHLQYQEGFLNDETYDATFGAVVRYRGPIITEVPGADLNFRRASFRDEIEKILAEQE